MLKSNAAKEVFYIFLWLIGIIFFYSLVHTFLLEPSTTTVTHTQHLADVKKTEDTDSTVQNVSKEPSPTIEIKNAKLTVIKEQKETIKNVLSVAEVSTVEVDSNKPNKANKSSNPLGKIKDLKIESITQKNISTPKVPHIANQTKSTLSVPSTPSVPSVPTIHTLIPKIKSTQINENREQNKTKKILKIVTKSLTKQNISIPTIPEEVTSQIKQKLSMPSVPSVPSIPSIPETINSFKTPIINAIPKVEDKKIDKELTTSIKALEKELSQKGKLNLLKTAREHVRDNAETARQKLIEDLPR